AQRSRDRAAACGVASPAAQQDAATAGPALRQREPAAAPRIPTRRSRADRAARTGAIDAAVDAADVHAASARLARAPRTDDARRSARGDVDERHADGAPRVAVATAPDLRVSAGQRDPAALRARADA